MQGPSIEPGKKEGLFAGYWKQRQERGSRLEIRRKTATGDARLDLVLHDLDVFFSRVAEVSSLDDTWHSYEKEPHPHFYRLCSRRRASILISHLLLLFPGWPLSSCQIYMGTNPLGARCHLVSFAFLFTHTYRTCSRSSSQQAYRVRKQQRSRHIDDR